MKALFYDVCTVRTGVVMHKLKFCAHGTPKQTQLLFQIDLTIHLTCHGSDSNMQISVLKPRIIPPQTVLFNDVVLVVTGP